jgi:hypothetical protein
VHVLVEPNDVNRTLEVVADSSNFYRSSRVTLERERSARGFSFKLRGVPSGEYELRCALMDAGGQVRAESRKTVTVLDSGR